MLVANEDLGGNGRRPESVSERVTRHGEAARDMTDGRQRRKFAALSGHAVNARVAVLADREEQARAVRAPDQAFAAPATHIRDGKRADCLVRVAGQVLRCLPAASGQDENAVIVRPPLVHRIRVADEGQPAVRGPGQTALLARRGGQGSDVAPLSRDRPDLRVRRAARVSVGPAV